ncbi:MAG: M16 family metallopeptidase [Candidatus Cryptobacteroides sp.]
MKRFLLIIAALFGAFAFSANAQMEQLPNDPAVRRGTLENGMTYYIMKNAQPEGRAEFYLATNVGAIQETPDQDGLAHFLEHMCFNGTKNFPGKGILDYLQSIGASFGGNVNAATGVEQTTYMLNNIPIVRQSVIDTCILIMHDYSHFVTCDPAEIDKERGVIIEERRSRRTADWRMHEQSLPYYYGDSKYATCTLIGSQENLSTFRPESLTTFYHTWYRPDLQALIVVGDIDEDYVESKIKEIFADIPAVENPKPKDVILIPGNVEPEIGILTDPEAVGSTIEVLWKGEAMPEAYNSTAIGEINDLIKNVISMVMTERFNDITAKADAPFLRASFGIGNLCETMEAQLGRISFKEGEGISAFKAYYSELLKMKKFGFSDDEIERAKSDLLSYYENAAKKADTRKNSELVQPLINNFFDNYAYMRPQDEYELVKQIFTMIPAQAINQTVSQAMIPDTNMVLIYKAPQKEGLAHPSRDDFKKAIEEVRASDIKPNETEAIASEFLDPATLKGSAVKSETSGKYGSTVWYLKNGLKVILRPADVEKNKIVFDLFKNGGISLVPDEDLMSFQREIWSTFQNFCGVGEFSGSTVDKMLSGKNVSCSPYISALRHGISGNSATQDLETALQLVYMYFMNPRFDSEEFGQAINQLEAIIPNYMKQPNYQLNLHINNTLYGDNPRVFAISDEVLKKASLATLEKNYRMLFNDAAGAVFTICGDFDINEVRPLIEKYLGSIRKGKKALKWRDQQTDILPGNVTDDFKVDMQTPKVTVIEVFDAFLDKYRMIDEVAMSAATYILDMRYVKSLREDEGGTYGASSYGMLDIYPRPESLLQVAFETNPSSADKLIKLSLEGLNSLAEDGPTAEEFDMAKKNLEKNIPESRITNRHWNNALRFNELYSIDYDAEYEAAVKALTPADIQNILKATLASGTVKTIVMRPDNSAEAE